MLAKQACELGVDIEAVVGRAPDWDAPWAGVRSFQVERSARGYAFLLISDDGDVVSEPDIQLARLSVSLH